jgi:hypothetical protein
MVDEETVANEIQNSKHEIPSESEIQSLKRETSCFVFRNSYFEVSLGFSV